MIHEIPDFNIQGGTPIADAFLAAGADTFRGAMAIVRHLPYGRNPDKDDPLAVFTDGCGTCSTKHALLKRLADEHGYSDIRLILGIFRMSGVNTPPVAATLKRHGLSYLPEAHNYLKHGDDIIDCTKPGFGPAVFASDLLSEVEIGPSDINGPKIRLHRQYLTDWLPQSDRPDLSLDELWQIREQCICDLSVL